MTERLMRPAAARGAMARSPGTERGGRPAMRSEQPPAAAPARAATKLHGAGGGAGGRSQPFRLPTYLPACRFSAALFCCCFDCLPACLQIFCSIFSSYLWLLFCLSATVCLLPACIFSAPISGCCFVCLSAQLSRLACRNVELSIHPLARISSLHTHFQGTSPPIPPPPQPSPPDYTLTRSNSICHFIFHL